MAGRGADQSTHRDAKDEGWRDRPTRRVRQQREEHEARARTFFFIKLSLLVVGLIGICVALVVLITLWNREPGPPESSTQPVRTQGANG